MNRFRSLAAASAMALVMSFGGTLHAADGNVEDGKELFETKCSVCHNADSKEKKIGPGLQGIKAGKLPSGKDTTHENVMENLNKGGGGMPAFEKLLADQEKADIVAYVLTL
jgi:mono/diheme cytochrome c family protein